MSDCIDRNIGILLHGYEMGILSAEEKAQFEKHIMKCEHCFNQLHESENEISMLTRARDMRKTVSEFVMEETQSRSFLPKILQYLWPKAPLVFKPALTYVLLILMAIPIYYGITHRSQPEIFTLGQRVVLQDDYRSSREIMTIDKKRAYFPTVEFLCDNIVKGKHYRVIMEYEDSSILHEDHRFTEFDDLGIARIVLPLPQLKPGKYYLKIYDPDDNTNIPKKEYHFEVIE